MRVLTSLSAILVVLLFTSCAHTNKREGEKFTSPLNHTNPTVGALLDSSVAYVVYPDIGKAAVIVGGASGKGDVYEKGLLGYSLVGHSELTQVNAGLQLGAQTYSEAIFFENQDSFAGFKRGEVDFAANLSGVFLPEGQKMDVAYNNGVAVIIKKIDGVMGELSAGGQKLSFQPL